MTAQLDLEPRSRTAAGGSLRERLLVELPVTERRLSVAGVSTAVLEGGAGASVILLHGPAASATAWMRVIPDLVTTHRVVVPDLPGHGASEVPAGPLDSDRVMAWLSALIERTCPARPALVGHALGGGIAARFAGGHGDRLSRLVLVDALGLAPFEPAPDFGRAVHGFLADPTERSYERLWRECAHDLDGLRRRMGERWAPFTSYHLERARSPGVMAALAALMEDFAMSAIPSTDLAQLAVPASLIWGCHDAATPLSVAASLSAEHGWPLHVIEDAADDPSLEQPQAFVAALRAALADPTH